MNSSEKRVKILKSEHFLDICSVLELYLENIDLIGEDDSLDIINKIHKNGHALHIDLCNKIYLKFQKLNSEIKLLSLIEKLRTYNTSKLSIDDLNYALSLPEKQIKKLLFNYLEACTNPFHISLLVKQLPKMYLDSDLIPILKIFLTNSDERVVSNTIEGLEAFESSNTTPIFAQMLMHPSHRVKAVAAKAISAIEPKRAQSVIKSMLQPNCSLEQLRAGCYAASKMYGNTFLTELIALTDIKQISEDAVWAIAKIASVEFEQFLDRKELRDRPALRNKIFSASIKNVRKQLNLNENIWNSQNKNGVCKVDCKEEKIKSLIPMINLSEANKLAENNKLKITGFFSRLVHRPKLDDIEQTYSETRLEPFWYIKYVTNTDYVRVREVSLDVEQNVKEILLGEQMLKASAGKLNLNLEERCVNKIQKNQFINAIDGSQCDFSYYINRASKTVNEIDELATGDNIILPPRIKASILVHEIIRASMKPIKAIEIIDQSLNIESMILFFRPVYAFEYLWKAKQKTVVFEIDAVTKEITIGKTFKHKIGEIIQRTSLFDIGADALGLVVPGGEIAAKLAYAVLSGKQK